MKTITGIIASAILLISTLSSCKKECLLCERGSEHEVRVCEDDFNSDSKYRQVMADLKADEYDCHN